MTVDGELSSETWTGPGLSPITVSYTYDGAGREMSETGPGGTTSYTYDANGDMTSATLPGGATIAYTYDADSEPTSLRYPDGTVASYSYTLGGQVASVSTAQGKAAYSYDADGKLIATSLPGGMSRHYTYSAGQLSAYTQSFGANSWQRSQTTTIRRNATGQITSETTDGRTSAYTYDPAGQLTSETLPIVLGAQVSISYTYDANGNRTNATVSAHNADGPQGGVRERDDDGEVGPGSG